MKTHVRNESSIVDYFVQSVKLSVTVVKAFEYIANPNNLPEWTSAFKRADHSKAIMVTPKGELPIGLKTQANKETGTVDWYMTLPDGLVGTAYSRVVSCDDGKCSIYSFVLLAPPVPLEELEGTLSQQRDILAHELQKLSGILEKKN